MPGDHHHRGVGRIDRVLDVVARAATPPRLADITAATGLPRSTTADLLGELRRHGYLRRSGTGYRLGSRPQVLGLLAGLGPPTPIDHQRLDELSRVARTPLALAVLVGGEVLYLDSAGPLAPRRLQHVADQHRPRPALRTAAGRLLLAMAEEEDRAAALRTIAETDPEAVAAFVRERPAIERARLARSDGLADPGIRAVAVPVVDEGDVVAAMVLLGPRTWRSAGSARDVGLDRAASRLIAAQSGPT